MRVGEKEKNVSVFAQMSGKVLTWHCEDLGSNSIIRGAGGKQKQILMILDFSTVNPNTRENKCHNKKSFSASCYNTKEDFLKKKITELKKIFSTT